MLSLTGPIRVVPVEQSQQILAVFCGYEERHGDSLVPKGQHTGVICFSAGLKALRDLIIV